MCAHENPLCTSFLVGLASRCLSAAVCPPRPSSVCRLSAPLWAERGSFAPGLPQAQVARAVPSTPAVLASGLLGARQGCERWSGTSQGHTEVGSRDGRWWASRGLPWALYRVLSWRHPWEEDVPLMIRVRLTSPLLRHGSSLAAWQGSLAEQVAPEGPGRVVGNWATLPSSLPLLQTVV